ncbi:hypothetical protein CCACVL1_18640 [Corchorus capsularis]|uniref:Uncharacterized protein n=1 Tax=Corchorus capsularis TaxID=210143 RepID=A0A1R3HKK5_COCAP|nr:hypothetical protein CCACVL1_18640 [Corchorus capsularis]
MRHQKSVPIGRHDPWHVAPRPRSAKGFGKTTALDHRFGNNDLKLNILPSKQRLEKREGQLERGKLTVACAAGRGGGD